MHEASCHSNNCFITLTYNEDHLPPGGSLHYPDWQALAKRWRNKRGKFRFLMAGEYGELGRPHYHAAIFGEDFASDRYQHRPPGENGYPIFRSPSLEALWSRNDQAIGFAEFGSLTTESAGYIARYCVKKVTGQKADAHYEGRTPEFIQMSRKPGIGHAHFKKFIRDFYPRDECVVKGKVARPPGYYDRLATKLDPTLMASLKAKRRLQALKHTSNNTPERLAVRHEFKQQQLTRLKRDL